MRKNLYLSLSILLALPFISFAQNGQSCNQALNYNIESEEDYYFVESQKWIYIDFTADDDSLELFILQGNNSETTFDLIEIYEKEECSSLTLVYSDTGNANLPVIYANLYSLNVGTQYMFKGRKIGPFEESEMKFSINKTLITPCNEPPLPCYSLIKNGDFTYTTVASPLYRAGALTAFTEGQVCDWLNIASTPDLVYKSGPNHNGPPLTNPYVYMGALAYNPILSNNAPPTVESIGTAINFQAGQKYSLSFALKGEANVAPNFRQLPDFFLVWLVNQADLDALTNIGSDLPLMTNKYEVMGLTKSQLSNTLTYYSKCFTPNQNYDRIVFFPYHNTPPQAVYFDGGVIHLDDIELITFDAGPDITITNPCEDYTLGGCSIPGATYQWSPSTGLSSTTVHNPIANPLTTTTYTVTVTQTNGCTLTDQVTVNVNNPVTIHYSIPHGQTSTWLHSNYTPLNDPIYQYYEDKNFIIEGDFTINDAARWERCNFYMAENARILFDQSAAIFSANNTANKSFIKPCDPTKRWDGIYVSQQSAIKILDFTIEGSENGISVVDEATFDFQRNDFVNNGKSITIEDFDGPFVGPPYITLTGDPVIKDNTFSCNAPINGSFGPYFPITAVEIKNYDDRNIPTSELDFSGNEFYGSGGGLIINNAYITIDDNLFQGFNNQFQFPGDPDKQTSAIKVFGSARQPEFTLQNSYLIDNLEGVRIEGDVKTRITDNKVNKNQTGFTTNGVTDSYFLQVIENPLLNTGNGDPSFPDLHLVSGNEVYNVKKGIDLFDARYFYIHNNTFDMEVQSGMYTSKNNNESSAIYVNTYTPGTIIPISPTIITNNNIKHAKIGIQAEFAWATVTDNVIEDMNNNFSLPPICSPIPPQGVSCPQTPAFGIKLINTSALVQGNEIKNDLSQYSGTMPNTQENVVAIDIENAVNPLQPYGPSVNCNKTEQTGIGFRFSGYNGQVELFKNNIISTKRGILTDNEAFIGNIGVKNNPLFSIEDATNSFSGNFLSLGGSQTYNISNFDPSYDPINGGLPDAPKYYYNTIIPQISPLHAEPGYQEFELQLTNQTITGINCTAPQLVQVNDGSAKESLFRSKNGRGNQRLYWNRKGNSSDSALYLRQQLQFYQLSKDSSLYNQSQFRTFKDSMKNTVLGRAFNRNSRAVNLSRLTNFDQHVLNVEPLLNKHFADSILNQAELNSLRNIAILCPYTNGIAVYQARRVLHEYGDRLLVSNCEVSNTGQRGRSKARIKASDSTHNVFKVFPNPSNGSTNLYFQTTKESSYSVEMIDLIGKRLKQQAVIPNTNNTFDVSEMQSGVYFIRLFEDGALIQTQKLVIQ